MAAITPTERGVRRQHRGRLQPAPTALLTLTLAFGAVGGALAHDPGLSSIDVRVGPREVTAVLSVAGADAELVGGRAVLGHVALESIDVLVEGERLAGRVQGISVDADSTVHARLIYQGHSGARVVVRSLIPGRLGAGHRELATVRGEDGSPLAEQMLDAKANEVIAIVGQPTRGSGSTSARFVVLGVEHILTGYDHLLFLAGLLVVARRWSDVIKTITAFTVAHSITLALAVLGGIAVPVSVVEPLIAASVVYVGLENLLRPISGSRSKLAFAFGLVHGLGFAAILSDLGIGTVGASVIVPLASFNTGVELGQIAVAAALVPIFWRLNAQVHPRVSFAAIWSLLVVMAGGYWLVERIV